MTKTQAVSRDYDRLQQLRDEYEFLAATIDYTCTASAYGLEQEAKAREALTQWETENLRELTALEEKDAICRALTQS